MRLFVILILSCGTSLASETGVHMTSVLSTNTELGVVHLEETFTRDGQTNLVRRTSLKDGVVTGRVQRFYHDGEYVAVHLFVTSPTYMARESFSTIASPYSVSLDFSPSKDIERVIISRKNGIILDGFTATNRVFYPVSNSDVKDGGI
jgi:hypothetical protein